MALKGLTSLFCLVLAVTNIQISVGDTIIKTTDFYDYIDVVKELPTVAAKLRVLSAVWAEIRCDYQSELKAVESLHKTIYQIGQQNATAVADVAQQQEIDEFYQKVRQVIITRNGQYLAQIINIKTKPLDFKADQFVIKIVNSFDYDPQVPYKIFENALDLMYGLKSTLELSEFLRSYEIVGNKRQNEILLQAQLYLYWKFIASNDIDDAYLLYIGYYLFEAETKGLVQLSNNEKRRLNVAIKSLPSTVQNLYFTKNICLLNAGNSEYLYEFSGAALDDKRRQIFTWRTKNSVADNGPYNVELSVTNTTIRANLRNVLYKHDLYRDENSYNQIFAWMLTSTQEAPNSRWSLALNDNKLSLYQSGSLYICSDVVHDQSRRYVRAIKQLASNLPSVCEWRVDNCPTVYG